MVKCPQCREKMILHEGITGQLTWVCYTCGQIGLPVGYIWKIT